MPTIIKTHAEWRDIAEQSGELDREGYANAFSAAMDASRGGKLTKLVKVDGSIVAYHNGSKVRFQ